MTDGTSIAVVGAGLSGAVIGRELAEQGYRIDIFDSRGTREDSTSTPTPAGSGFTVTWLAAGTPTRAG